MFHFNKSFFIVLVLSVVCFSFGCAGDNDEIFACMHSMINSFGLHQRPIDNIKHAIMFMKLYGENSYIYHMETILYYQYFHLYLNPGEIYSVDTFCAIYNHDQDCYNELKIFENYSVTSDIMKNFADDELQLLYNIVGDVNVSEGSGNFSGGPGNFSEGSSSSSVDPSRGSSVDPSRGSSVDPSKDVKAIILKNALYFHVIGDPPLGTAYTDESRKYFHKIGSFGESYLRHISDYVKFLDTEILDSPWNHCRQKYINQVYLINPVLTK